MNPAYLHLLLNHFPIILPMVGIALLLTGILIKSPHLRTAGLVLFIAAATFAVPVFLTGEPAEEAVENIAGISKTALEEHEELAETAIWLIGSLGIVSLLALGSGSKMPSMRDRLTLFALVLALIATGLMVMTGSQGGRIRHTDTGNAQTESGAAESEEGRD